MGHTNKIFKNKTFKIDFQSLLLTRHCKVSFCRGRIANTKINNILNKYFDKFVEKRTLIHMWSNKVIILQDL
jgi:hypothetical protein